MGKYVRSLGLAGLGDEDWATPVQRARMNFLSNQLHAIGDAIAQAQARGDTAAVDRLRAIARPLIVEQKALQDQIIAQGNAGKKAAEANPYGAFQGLYNTLTGAAKYAALGLAAIFILPALLRRRGK